MDTLITKSKVEELLPQKKPFVMVSFLYNFNETSITTGFEILSDNLFVEDDKFNESGLIENMAQSIALHTNYDFFLKNKTAPVGYIGSIKNVKLIELPKVGETIKTDVKVLQEFMGVTLVDAVVTCGDKEIISAQLKTVLAE
jgi:predicted hotdog family 3-hydroxylacyl-ACP dehydratase